MPTADVVIVGAGPYGLVAAAHLRAAGIEPRVFGEVMGFWKALPEGMLLRSEWPAAHLIDPANPRTLFDYETASNQLLPKRIPMTEFARYGDWFQRGSVPNVDPRLVESVTQSPRGFHVRLADGESLSARRVIIATGITNFAKWPDFATRLPRHLVTHTADARDYAWLAGKNVAVLGCGQSALEASALLREVNAEVEIIARQPIIRWLSYSETIQRKRSIIDKVLRPPGALGPIGINWIIQIPALFRSVPEPAQPLIAARALRPAGTGWLRERVNGVVYTVNETIAEVTVRGEKLELVLGSGGRREVDHLVLGSGYDVHAAGYRFLCPEIVAGIRTIRGQAALTRGFESSVPGLHFIGPGSDESFGPLLHSVAGTEYAGKSVARALKKAMSPRRFTVPPISAPPFGGVSISPGSGN